jgi:hypothetical protein
MKWDFEVVTKEFAMLISFFGLTIDFFPIPKFKFCEKCAIQILSVLPFSYHHYYYSLHQYFYFCMKWDFEVVTKEFAMLISFFGLTIDFFPIP